MAPNFVSPYDCVALRLSLAALWHARNTPSSFFCFGLKPPVVRTTIAAIHNDKNIVKIVEAHKITLNNFHGLSDDFFISQQEPLSIT